MATDRFTQDAFSKSESPMPPSPLKCTWAHISPLRMVKRNLRPRGPWPPRDHHKEFAGVLRKTDRSFGFFLNDGLVEAVPDYPDRLETLEGRVIEVKLVIVSRWWLGVPVG